MFLHISPEQSVVIIVYLEFKNLINYQVKKVKNESTFKEFMVNLPGDELN